MKRGKIVADLLVVDQPAEHALAVLAWESKSLALVIMLSPLSTMCRSLAMVSFKSSVLVPERTSSVEPRDHVVELGGDVVGLVDQRLGDCP